MRLCEERGEPASLVTPFSRSLAVAAPIFGVRRVVGHLSGDLNVAGYRYWHFRFLRHALFRELRGSTETVVYASCPLSARAAIEARRNPLQRVVMAVHFDTSQADEWVDKGQIERDGAVYSRIRELERCVLPSLDGIVYVSASAMHALRSWLPEVALVPSTTIPNFVHSRGPHVAPGGRKRDLISVGSLEAAKNHAFLLQVIAQANRLGHRYTLDIAGAGPCRSDLERLSKTLGLRDQVRLLGYRSDVRELLPGYRAYVHSSRREVMGMAAIEALAAGLPVVAAPVGGFPEIVEPGVEGLFWSLADPEGAANILVRLLEDEPAREKMAAAARARFERQLAAEAAGPRLLDFLLRGAVVRPVATA